MDLSLATFWWVAAGIAVAVELATGTFYLLMLALGMAAAAIAAHFGASHAVQITTAALVGGGATALWHWKRRREPEPVPLQQNRDVNLDVGERIRVAEWAADRTARVSYRGSTWTARLHPDATAAPGEYVVGAVEGNWLVLQPAPAN